MASETKALTVAKNYHRAWTGRHFDEAAELLAENLKIDVPINSYSTKTSFMDAVKKTQQMTSNVNVLSELGNDREALLLYDLTLPFGEMRIAEHFTVAGGRITRIRHVHDTAALRVAMAAAGGGH